MLNVRRKRKLKTMIKIGVDPDTEKNGVCWFNNSKDFSLHLYTFFELFIYFGTQPKESVHIYIEAGWLNKSNWHKKNNGSAAVNATIGNRTGANHEVGRKIVEMCEYLGLDYTLIKPIKSKLKVSAFRQLTGFKGKVTQEEIDACMLVWGR